MTDPRDELRRVMSQTEEVDLPPEMNDDLPVMSSSAGPIELTEDGVARAFVARHGSVARFDHEAGAWFIFTGDHWRQDDTARAFDWCRRIAREASDGKPTRELIQARKASFASGVERLARSDAAIAVTSDHWNGDPMLLGCPGATVDLRDGTGRKPDPDDGITTLTAVAPVDGDCPNWMRFLAQVTRGDEEAISFLQLFAGYALTGRTIEHVLLFIFGPGGNGKSLFLNVLARIMGGYAVTASMETFTASHGDRHPTDLAMLRGARLVTASETEEGRSWAESRIKAITGGDPITARFMRGDFFTYQPSFKLVMTGNHQPLLRNVDPAIRRRFLIMPFLHRPDRPDLELEDKLWDEAPQILAWAIRGCLAWQDEGLPRPGAVAEATDDYFADQDSFGEWVAQCCRIGDADDYATSGDLFFSWKCFAESNGERPGTQKRLAARLRRLGLSNDRRTIQGRSQRLWMGIAVRSGE